MDRMTAMDATFLYSEDGHSHNDIGMVLVFDGPGMTREEVMQVIADRIALVPRFRQRVKHMPFATGLPAWMDDVYFDMGRHVFHHPAPAAADPVGAAVSQVMSGLMDLTIPLWQVHLITGLAEGRWLLIVRMHHAMVDGVHSTEIVRLLLSPKPEGEPPVLDIWRPRPEVPDAMLMASAAVDAVKDTAKAWAAFLRGTPELPKLPDTFDPSPFMNPGIPISPTAINGPVHTARRWGMIDVELSTIKRIRDAFGGTVNDVLLAACAYGFSSVVAAYLNETVQDRTLRAMVPVSLHSGQADGGAHGNEVGAMVVELPLGDVTPSKRLDRIHAQTQAFKQLKNAMPANTINPGEGLTSPLTLIMGSRIASTAPTFVNTVITNVPGPQNRLYLAGRQLHRLAACIALWSPLQVAVSVLSYNGVATIGAVTDDATLPNVTALLDAIGEGMKEFEQAAAEVAT